MFQHPDDDGLCAPGCDGHRDFTVIRPGDFHDGVDRFDLRHQWQIRVFLFVRRRDVVKRDTLFLGEHLQDVTRRHAAE